DRSIGDRAVRAFESRRFSWLSPFFALRGLGHAGRPLCAGNEAERQAIDAVAEAGRRRPVVEQVAEMPAAAAAVHLRAVHPERVSVIGADGVRQHIPKRRPAFTGIVFRSRAEQCEIAAVTLIGAFALLAVERAGKWLFGAGLP